MPLPLPVAVRLTTLPSHPCNYLPGKTATTRAFQIEQLPGSMYEEFMNAGFRRSGTILYQPVCEACELCVPIRLRVECFEPSKSQRRCARMNSDLVVCESDLKLTDEKFELYRRYLIGWHNREPDKADDRQRLEEFLYQSPVHTVEFCYRTSEGKLVGVGLADVSQSVLSSVYFYFDPEEARRGLGTFAALWEIEWCRRVGISFYYLGFWIKGCQKMEYKSNFRPAEILGQDGIWRLLVETHPHIE